MTDRFKVPDPPEQTRISIFDIIQMRAALDVANPSVELTAAIAIFDAQILHFAESLEGPHNG